MCFKSELECIWVFKDHFDLWIYGLYVLWSFSNLVSFIKHVFFVVTWMLSQTLTQWMLICHFHHYPVWVGSVGGGSCTVHGHSRIHTTSILLLYSPSGFWSLLLVLESSQQSKGCEQMNVEEWEEKFSWAHTVLIAFNYILHWPASVHGYT